MMLDIIKKTMLAGVGLTLMTKEKIEKIASELIEKGQMSEKEGKEFIDELIKKTEQTKKELETTIENILKKLLDKMNLATKDDINKLEKKIQKHE
jgi:polyhydroxyalkanoate synthesis regulator phasin